MSSSVLKKENEHTAPQNDDATQELSAQEAENDNASSSNNNGDADDIGELRKLLVKPGEVSEVLPDAVRKSQKKDGNLAAATLPIVEDNIRQSAARNPKILAQALYPVIGPAIRKAISQALGAMVQSLNQTLEHSISPKGIGWRIEALRTGKSFGEIVMMKTLLYKVEQVFLIHKETGLLLQHVTSDQAAMQDADMVSAMLTAIQDFVQDSFKTSDEATLDSLKIEELTVWIEHSPDAVIAGVIRGTPPLTLRETFSQAAEEIQYYQEPDLKNFNGDADVFDKSRPILERCLEFRANTEKKTNGILKPMNILGMALLALFLIGSFFYLRDYYRWSNFIERLNEEPGILVVEADRGFFTHSVSGLRDPLSVDPEGLVEEYGYSTSVVEQKWKAYFDTDSRFLLERAKKVLNPPEGVKLNFSNGVLSAKGNASENWVSDSKRLSISLLGVEEFRFDGSSDDLNSRIESQAVMFECNTADFKAGEDNKLNALVKDIENITSSGEVSEIVISGHASNSGSDETNDGLSVSRANKVAALLLAKSEKVQKLVESKELSVVARGIGASGERKGCAVTFSIKGDSE